MSSTPINERSIAVIGAGPAGLLCALELRDRGHRNVTVFGRLEEAQARTVEVDGVPCDVGTCYLHCGYWNTVAPLVRRFGLRLEHLGQPSLLTHGGAEYVPPRGERAAMALAMTRFLGSNVGYFLRARGEGSRAYGVAFAEFLRARNLEKLGESFAFRAGGYAQGYGPWRSVTAYGAMRWMRPTLFLTPVMNGFNRGTACIQEGYGTLFARIRAELAVEPATVKSVQPDGAAGVAIETAEGAVRHFDRAVLACTGAPIASPIAPLLAGAVTHTRLFSFLWTTTAAPRHRKRVYLIHRIEAEAEDSIVTYRHYGRTPAGRHVYWGVGYAADGTDRPELEAALRTQVADELGLPVTEVRFHEIFAYNRRFTAEAVRQGVPLEIGRRQGEGGIWYSGGLLSHWDVSSICVFNRRLVRRLRHDLAPRSTVREMALTVREWTSVPGEW